MENETISALAICLSIIAILSVIGVGTYVYFTQPEEVDLNGIFDNTLAINVLQEDVEDLQDDFDDLDLTCDCEVDEDDLEDLQDDIKDLENNIEDCAEDYPNNITKLASCLKKL